mgnify:CR=1 FL=1
MLEHCPNCEFDLRALLKKRAFPYCPKCGFPLTALSGQYQIEQQLGKGGYGAVYKVQHVDTRQIYALKVLKPEIFTSKGRDSILLRFLREIRVTTSLAQLNPHIVNIFEAGEDPDLGPYYLMEYLQGQTLAALSRATPEFTWPELVHLFKQLCSALQAAHEQQVVHRDLKPNNIFIVHFNGDPLFLKVFDFGIAKAMEGTLHPELTKGKLGTPNYMSPEQCEGKEIDTRADIYALGAILYYMLTKTPPFVERSLAALMMAHIRYHPEPLSLRCPTRRFPMEVEDVIDRALAKSPEHRYQSPKELGDAFEQAVRTASLLNDPYDPSEALNGATIQTAAFQYPPPVEAQQAPSEASNTSAEAKINTTADLPGSEPMIFADTFFEEEPSDPEESS